MRVGWTLTRYFTVRFAKTIFAIFGLCIVLIAVIDYVELSRRAYSTFGFDARLTALDTILRTPNVAEAVLPFATLFGAIAAFAIANRRLELVVARAAGVSAWQFILPGAVIGLLVGLFATTLFNPLAASWKEWAVELERGPISATNKSPGGPVWLRQGSEEGDSIIGATSSAREGLSLSGVTAFVFDPDGKFRERVDAPSAELVGNEWKIERAMVTRPNAQPRQVDVYGLPTVLTQSAVKQAFGDPDTISFWDLPRMIELAEQSTVPVNKFRMQYQLLIAKPMLLLAMVLIAGAVSLRFTRLDNLGGMIITGVVAGFVLYVANEITRGLGGGGLVAPVFAAWLPAVMATLISVTILLREEDG